MHPFLCEFDQELDLEDVLDCLEKFGLKESYFIEEQSPKKILLGGFVEKIPSKVQGIKVLPPPQFIDWEQQSKLHSPYYKEGLIQIDLGQFVQGLKKPACFNLLPGPGFGDISHETTQLMISNLASHVQDKIVIDIGAGNGVLSFASYYLGAKAVLGLEIDRDSLKHAKKNSSLNGIDTSKVLFSEVLPGNWLEFNGTTILMNMTYFEQLEVFKDLDTLFLDCSTLISSGILSCQKDEYKKLMDRMGFTISQEAHLENWMFFIFHKT